MLNTDRTDFLAQLNVLFGGFPTFLTEPRIEAYWRGLQKMPMPVFTRCVDQVLGEKGEAKLPTVNRIWQVSRDLRANAPVAQETKDAVETSVVWGYGNRAMLNYLMRKEHGASYESLLLMLAAKKHLCDAYELICEEEPEASLELRDKLFDAWDTVYVPMPAAEAREDQEFYWRTGRQRSWRDPTHAIAYLYTPRGKTAQLQT